MSETSDWRYQAVTKPKGSPPVTASGPSGPKGVSNSPIKRRSSRVAIEMPVEVFGQQANGKVFREETRTTIVNAHGALLILPAGFEIKPSVLLINKTTKLEVQCRVISQKETEKGKSELGVEFVTPQPRFWGIAFPPDDWNNA
ncbi:MAG: PilZ domain-containing protein, partial [Candidatus Acidiferrales bacterium]